MIANNFISILDLSTINIILYIYIFIIHFSPNIKLKNEHIAYYSKEIFSLEENLFIYLFIIKIYLYINIILRNIGTRFFQSTLNF